MEQVFISWKEICTFFGGGGGGAVPSQLKNQRCVYRGLGRICKKRVCKKNKWVCKKTATSRYSEGSLFRRFVIPN